MPRLVTNMPLLQGELDQEQHSLAAEQAAKKTLQTKLAASEERLERSQREARETVYRLEQKVNSLQAELAQWQQEVSSAESEIGRLMSLQRKVPRPAFQRTFSTSSHSSTPRTRGGGSLHFNDLVATNGKDAGASSAVDLVYLKNVLLKFIIAASEGKIEQCQVLLPPVATLLHATPQEFGSLKAAVQNLTWWPQTG